MCVFLFFIMVERISAMLLGDGVPMTLGTVMWCGGNKALRVRHGLHLLDRFLP